MSSPHLAVDDGGDLGRVVRLVAEVAPEEHLALHLAELLRAEALAHAVLRDHAAGDVRAALDVVGRARGDLAEHELLRGAAAEQHRHRVLELGAGVQVLVLEGQGQRPAEGAAAGDDRHLVDRVGAPQHVAHERVAALVVGDRELLLLAHHPALALRTGQHAVDGGFELGVADALEVTAGGEERRLVHEVGEVGAGEPGRATGQHVEADVGLERLALGVHLEDRLAALEVGAVDDDLAVEATGPQEGGVEDVGAVRRRDEDHAAAGVEAVHLDEHLVERLLALVVTAAEPGAAMAADGVDLVHEDDRRGRRLGLLEQVADAAGADAHEHLDEVRARDREEGHARLAGHRAGQQRLAGARRARRAARPWGSWRRWPGSGRGSGGSP